MGNLRQITNNEDNDLGQYFISILSRTVAQILEEGRWRTPISVVDFHERKLYSCLRLSIALFLLRTLLICIGHLKLTLEFCVSVVLSGSYTVCMGYLMKFPRVYDDVYHYVKAALAMRENKVSCDWNGVLCPFYASRNSWINVVPVVLENTIRDWMIGSLRYHDGYT